MARDQRVPPRGGGPRQGAAVHGGGALDRRAAPPAHHRSSRRDDRSAAPDGRGARDRRCAAASRRARSRRPVSGGRDLVGRRLRTHRSAEGARRRMGSDARHDPVLRDHRGASDAHSGPLRRSRIGDLRVARRWTARRQRSVQHQSRPTRDLRCPHESPRWSTVLQRRRLHRHQCPTGCAEHGGGTFARREHRADDLARKRVRGRSRALLVDLAGHRSTRPPDLLLPQPKRRGPADQLHERGSSGHRGAQVRERG